MGKKIKININYLRPNSTLVYPLFDDEGRKVLHERTLMTKERIESIKEKHGHIVFFFDQPELAVIPSYRLNIALNQSRDVLDEVNATGKLSKTAFRGTEQVVEEIVSDLQASDIELLRLLDDLSSNDDYLYYHAVNVGILAGAFARLLGHGPEEIKQIVLGGFLIDIGHMVEDTQLVKKEGILSGAERQRIKRHPQLGYELLKNIQGISPIVLQAVLFHHERFNNEGYFHMPYENLPLPPKIVSACDYFDALTTARPYREAFSSEKALKVLLNSINIHFDFDLISSFINRIGPLVNNSQSFYTNYELCELNTQELALIREIGQKNYLKPRVLIFCRFQKKGGELAVSFFDSPLELDLQDDPERHITKILDNHQQIEMIRKKLKEKGILQLQ